jgi:hypothetical protein
LLRGTAEHRALYRGYRGNELAAPAAMTATMNAAPTEPTTIAMSRGIPSVVGVTVGSADGYAEGTAVGCSEGGGDGGGEGWAVGMGVGTGEGRTDGPGVVGVVVGVSVGHHLSLHPMRRDMPTGTGRRVQRA